VGKIEIFDNPKLKSILRDITEGGFTTLMWGGWIYLLLPLLNLSLWFLGLRFIYIEFFQIDSFREFLGLLTGMGWAIIGIFIILRGWGLYNYYRFGKKNRRSQLPANHLNEKMAVFFQISPEEINLIQNSKEVVWPLGEEPVTDLKPWLEKRTPTSIIK
jgi:poly-beta-1,6-N-acetyl-D-glucosamine biosynthesis protein PgaD